MRMLMVLGVAVLGLLPPLARAADTTNFDLSTTKDLYAVCSAASNDPLRPEALNFCEGFLLGVVRYHDAIVDRKHLKPLFCYPSTATRDEAIQAFVDWAGSHQQDQKLMSAPPIVGAIRGLAAKWPCK